MNEDMHATKPRPEQAEAVCELCGRPDATRFGDGHICDTCYIERGSCCAESCDEE
jgi:hypothetical protein